MFKEVSGESRSATPEMTNAWNENMSTYSFMKIQAEGHIQR